MADSTFLGGIDRSADGVTAVKEKATLTTAQAIADGKPYKIQQSETLYTTRPRYFNDPQYRGRPARLYILPDKGSVDKKLSGISKTVRNKLVGKSTDKDGAPGFAEFILQGLSVQYAEKQQIFQTFGDAESVYYFGRTPTMLTLQGTLIDDLDNDWFVRFMTAYDEFLRGTKLAENFESIKLDTPNALYQGSIINLSHNQASNRDTDISFSMTMVVREFEYISAYQYGKQLVDDALFLDFDEASVPTIEWKSIQDRREATNAALEGLTSINVGVGTPNLPAPIGGGTTSSPVTGSSATLGPKGTESSINTLKPKGFLARQVDKAQTISTKIVEFFKGVAKTITAIADKAKAKIDKALKPLQDLLGKLEDFSDSAIAIVASVENAFESFMDPIQKTVAKFRRIEERIKNIKGIITSLPETLAERASRFTRSGGMNTSPLIFGSSSASISAADASAILRDTNYRAPASVGRITASSGDTGDADEMARLGV